MSVHRVTTKKECVACRRLCSVKRGGILRRRSCQKSTAVFGLSLKEIAQEANTSCDGGSGTALWGEYAQIIVGLGKITLVRFGNKKEEQILRDAAEASCWHLGFPEPANDRVLFGSISEARPEE